MFGHSAAADEAAGVFRLGDEKAAVAAHFGNREAHVGVAASYRFPVGEVAAGGLGTALEQMPGQAALGQLVVVLPAPAELVHQRCQYQGTVCHPAGNNYVRALFQSRNQTWRSQIGIQADHHWRHRLAGTHLVDTHIGQLFLLHQQVVAQHQGNLHVHTCLFAEGLQGVAAGDRIYAAGVGKNADTFFLDLCKQGAHDRLDEIPRIPLGRILHLLASHNGHGDFCQIVGNQIVDAALMNQLRGCGFRIAPESGGASDANGFWGFSHVSVPCLWLPVRCQWQSRFCLMMKLTIPSKRLVCKQASLR